VIALAVERQRDGETLVTVLPVTMHRAPDDATAAVEIPGAVFNYLAAHGIHLSGDTRDEY
jgi:hypothetical protein